MDFWKRVLGPIRSELLHSKVLDVACGDGALANTLAHELGGRPEAMVCLDYSFEAVQIVKSCHQNVNGVVSDAKNLPFTPGAFDMVTSQFGVEYAGPLAAVAAAELVAPECLLALLMHHRNGIIFEECQADARAIRELLRLEFIGCSLDMFTSAQKGDEQLFFSAENALAEKFSGLESMLDKYGPKVAGGTLLQLYQHVAKVHDNLRRYDLNEVVDWLNRVEGELPSYAGRMQSMCDAALDKSQFDEIVSALQEQSFSMIEAGALIDSKRGGPLGWMLVARAPSASINT